jgi:hypothetical protein
MIITYDLTSVNQMNGGQPVYGRGTRAVAQACRLFRPVKFLYYTQLFPLEEVADDGLPIVFDDEVRYHAGKAGGDPAELNALMLAYAGVVARVKALAPSCPVSVYGISPNEWAKGPFTIDQWTTACKPLFDLQDFAFADLSDGTTPPAQFDALLAGLSSLRTQFPGMPIMVKINPQNCTDNEFRRRLVAAGTSPNVDQICVWMEGSASWIDSNLDAKLFPAEPTLTLNYWDIARDLARQHPGGRSIVKPQTSPTSSLTDKALVQQMNDAIGEVNRRQAALGVLATFWKNTESAAAALIKK